MKTDQIFEKSVKQVMQPKLFSLGFEGIKLKDGWISPQYLYERDNIWLGASWDWRDHYLEIDLGRLFFFKDVLPRVIVIGTIDIGDTRAREFQAIDEYETYFREMFTQLNATLDEKILSFEAEFPGVFARKTELDVLSSKKERQYYQIFLAHLGGQLKRSDLPCE